MDRRYFRLDRDGFTTLLRMIAPHIQKSDTNMRKSISPAERLSVTLRYLATGETFHSLAFAYRIGERTISNIVAETCSVIYNCLKDDYLQVPTTEGEWLKISKDFEEKWNYPFCLGALDGKHICIRQPANSGSTFFNYKHYFSIVLFALVDANYRFVFVDVGSTGRSGDAGVFLNSALKEAMDSGSLSFPPPGDLTEQLIDGKDKPPKCNYHIIGDDAFPLRLDLVKPFPMRSLTKDQRIFNYRFSRARRVVENAFGILANRFRLFLTTICLDPDKVEKAVLAACCLHNFLLDNSRIQTGLVDREDTENHCMIPGSWREGLSLPDVVPTSARNFSLSAKGQREMLKLYFNSEQGRVHWQDSMI